VGSVKRVIGISNFINIGGMMPETDKQGRSVLGIGTDILRRVVPKESEKGNNGLENRVIKTINGLLLARKSSEVQSKELVDGLGYLPSTCASTVVDYANNILGSLRIDPNDNTNIGRWNRWWAQQHAAASHFGEGKYHKFLPGRSLKYERLADAIASLYGMYTEDKKIIELGSGSGLSLRKLAKKGALVTGLDSSRVALKFSKFLVEQCEIDKGKLIFVNGDFYNTGFNDKVFDTAYSSGVFEHFEEELRNQMLDEMIRITKPGSYIVISIPNTKSPFYRSLKKREKEDFKKYKDYGLEPMPWEDRRYSLDLKDLAKNKNLEVIKEDGLQMAPSCPVKKGDIKPEDLEFFIEYLQSQPLEDIEGKMIAWRALEGNTTQKQRLHYGWSRYIILQKPLQ